MLRLKKLQQKNRKRKTRTRKRKRKSYRRGRKSRQHGGLLTRGTPKSNSTHHTKHTALRPLAIAIRGGRRKKKKFRKGSKSKTHRGKDFETRKTSKNYSSKRWKRLTGRRTMRAPLFPFV